MFAKIFLPHLKSNMQAEVRQREIFIDLGIDEIRAPGVLDHDEDDLLVVQEPIENGVTLPQLRLDQLRHAMGLLARGLAAVRLKSLSQEPVPIMQTATQIPKSEPGSPVEWALASAREWAANCPQLDALVGREISRVIEADLSNDSVWCFGDLAPEHLFYRNDHLIYVDYELARRRADLYDIAYFCHRVLTTSPLTRPGSVVELCHLLIDTFFASLAIEGGTVTRDRLARQIHALFGLRVLGGFNDHYHFGAGEGPEPHLAALERWREWPRPTPAAPPARS